MSGQSLPGGRKYPALNIEAFLALVMAPLPGGEEAVDSPSFCRQIRLDMERVWKSGMRQVRLAEANHNARIALMLVSDKNFFDVEGHVTAAAMHGAREEQCLIPAPTAKELRWKKRVTKWRSKLPEEIKRAIALDEKRFAGGAA